MYPVVENGRLVGCITSGEVKKLPQEAWLDTTVGEAATRLCAENSVGPETDSVVALTLMRRTGKSRFMITEGDHLVGVLSLKDMLEFLSLKVDLGD
jgi:CBS domain-containing protein